MPSAAKKQPERAIALIRKQGIARLSELMSAGVSQETVARLSREGRITRLARGLYQLPDAELATSTALRRPASWFPRVLSASSLPSSFTI